MKQVIKDALNRAGIYYAKRQYMPCGIDWLWDIRRLLGDRSVSTVFDVGANIGQTTSMIKKRFPAAAVHAFEPVQTTYQSLQRTVRGLSGVTCHRLALCERVGQSTMTATQDSVSNRLLSDAEGDSGALIESVETDTVDHFCAARKIASIDILKVDAEGADLRVLQGGEAMIRQGKVAFAFVEFGFDPDDSGHAYFPSVYDYLEKAGMRVYSFYDYYHVDEGRRLIFANVLFLSPPAIAALR